MKWMPIMFSTDTLKVETADGLNMVLLESFTYTRSDGKTITVPVGTTSDGASTPNIIWPTFPPFGLYWKAAFLHDYLYRDTGEEKEFCDDTFLEAMESLGVSGIVAHTMYEGVSLLGWHAFSEDREAIS